MRTDKLYDLLEECKTPTKTKEVLNKHLDNVPNDTEDLVQYLKYMLDPTITYGIKKVTIPDEHLFKESACYVQELLNMIDIIISSKGKNIDNLLKRCTQKEQKLVLYCIKRKHPNKIGIKLVNSIFPDLIFQVLYMGALPGTPERVANIHWPIGVSVQPKMDGMAVLAYVYTNHVKLYTRQSRDITEAFPAIKKRLITAFNNSDYSKYSDYLHMEFLVYDTDGKVMKREKGNGILNKIIKGSKKESDYCIDPCILDVNVGGKNLAQTDRYEYMVETYRYTGHNTGFDIVEQHTVCYKENAAEIHDSFVRRGYEGTVWKDPNSVWKNGKHANLLKIKPEVEVELKVIGINEHKERPGEVGSLICKSSDSKVLVSVSGLTDIDRTCVWDTFLDEIVAVRANAIISSKTKVTKSLLNPRFIEVRFDKTEADSLEQIEESFNNIGVKTK